MQAIDRGKLAVLMVVHLLWGVVLCFSISKLGLGISTDSVPLLFAGTSLAAGRGLLSFDGTPVLLWPPLYPVLMAALHLVLGISAFAAAHVLQALAFAGLSVCLSILLLRIFPDDFVLVLAGNVLSDIGVVVVINFGMVGSDYIFLFLVVLCALLTACYVERPSGRLYVAVFLAAMLAMLQRYLGVAALAMAVTCVLFWAQADLRQRLLRSGFLLLAAVPAAVWQLLTAPMITRRAPVSFADDFAYFSRSIFEWVLSPELIKAHQHTLVPWLWVALVGMAVVVLLSRRLAATSFAAPVLLFGLFYLLALFGTAAIAYYNKLGGRFLLPLYIPLIVLLLAALHAMLRLMRRLPGAGAFEAGRLAAYALLLLLAILLLQVSVPVIRRAHAAGVPDENVFNTLAWRENNALQFWEANKPAGDYLLFSNQPDGVAFYSAHECAPSPRRFSGPYGKVEFSVQSYAHTLFGSGQQVYIVWIETEGRDYYYRPGDLAPIANIEQLYSGPDGGVFRLTPRPGSP